MESDDEWVDDSRNGMLPVLSTRHRYEHRGGVKFDALKREAFIGYVRMGVRRVRASEMVGVHYSTVAEALNRDPQFAADVSIAEMARIDEVEEALYETAINGNVVAQQVVLYNRRPDEWADQRMLRSRLERAEERAAETEDEEEMAAVDALRAKLLEVRERLSVDVVGTERETEEEPARAPDPES